MLRLRVRIQIFTGISYQERKDMLSACKYIHHVVESPSYHLSEEFIENHNIYTGEDLKPHPVGVLLPNL